MVSKVDKIWNTSNITRIIIIGNIKLMFDIKNCVLFFSRSKVLGLFHYFLFGKLNVCIWKGLKENSIYV